MISLKLYYRKENEKMAEEIVSDIFRIPLPLPNLSLESINVYLLKADKGWILVDTGMDHPQVYTELRQQLESMGGGLEKIKLIILTHNHPDHSGLAGRIQEKTNATIAIHKDDIKGDAVDDAPTIDTTLIRTGLSENRIKQLMEMGQQMSRTSKPFRPDWLLKGNEQITAGRSTFQVLLTPGHTPGHVCLYDREREILLSGDHVLPNTTPNIGYGPHNPLGKYIVSLREVKDLPIRIAFPSHGGSIDNTKKRVNEILAHHEFRISQILAVVDSSNQTALSIASKLDWKGGSVSWSNMKSDEQSMALLETLAHLEFIVNQQKISKIETKDFMFFQAI